MTVTMMRIMMTLLMMMIIMMMTVTVMKMMMTMMTFNGLQDCGRKLAEDTNLAPLAPA